MSIIEILNQEGVLKLLGVLSLLLSTLFGFSGFFIGKKIERSKIIKKEAKVLFSSNVNIEQ